MNPRLKTSKKWTTLPKDFLKQIEKVFYENFSKELKKGSLILEGRVYSNEIMLRVGINNKGRLRQDNFEVSMDYGSSQDEAIECIHMCVDVAASMMADFFETQSKDEELDFPIEWQQHDFKKKKVYLRYTTENSDLEEQADRFLGKFDDKLVKGADTEDEDE